MKELPPGSYRPISKEDINKSGLDYIIFGHFHNLLDLKKVPCHYSGTPEGLTFKNKGDKVVLLVSYSAKKVNVKPIKVNEREFQNVEIDCTNFESESRIRKITRKNRDWRS